MGSLIALCQFALDVVYFTCIVGNASRPARLEPRPRRGERACMRKNIRIVVTIVALTVALEPLEELVPGQEGRICFWNTCI